MKYQDQQLLDALAVDFILGAMKGAARRRFQHLMMADIAVRKTVWRWEQHLNPMAEALPATQPDRRVWLRVQQRLGWLDVAPVSAPAKSTRPYWLALATAASLLLAVILLPSTQTVPLAQDVAVIQTTDAKILWLISKADQQLAIKATAAVDRITDNDYELWMLPANGQAPISLGLLPQRGELTVSWPNDANGIRIAALAVSLEPLGGSPTGAPTGPVLYTAELMSL